MTDTVIASATGKCLCGSVTITAKTLEPLVDICHCVMCRRWTGGPFMGVSISAEGGEFEVSGTEHVTSFASSNWAERAFCSKCGSNLWYRFTPTDHYSFTAGLFEMGSEAEIEQQIFVDEKPAFYDFAQKTPMKTGAEIIAEAEAEGLTFDV